MAISGTHPTQIRLTDEDRDKMSVIQQRYGLRSIAAVIRFGIDLAYQTAPPRVTAEARKKSLKNSE